ncbi:MAG: Uma2 family endonuclease [Gammaproteobacteria bacterium]|nr:Uma2 family endonuclease [Gammaproteobacteria bacterium]
MTEALAFDDGIEYPTRDGRPVAETPLHYKRLADAAHALFTHYETRPGAYVGVNMMVYDERGNPRRFLSPDIFVAFGVEDRERDIYKIWEERAPSFVLEMTSKSTRKEDERKMVRYARWGVTEYFLYDPRREYVKPPLRAFELVRGTYRAMRPVTLSNRERGIPSSTLGLELWLEGSVLRFYDPATGRNLLTPRQAQLRAEVARLETIAARSEAIAARSDADAARSDADAARSDADAARSDADVARSEAEAANARAAEEAAKRKQLEAELARLKR